MPSATEDGGTSLPLLQVRENPPDHLRILNTGNDPRLPPAALALLDVNARYGVFKV